MSTALVAFDGVIRHSNGHPIPEGVRLYNGLVAAYRVVLALDDTSVEQAETWLRLEGLRGHQEVLASVAVDKRGEDRRQGQVDILQGRGYEVSLVVECDPVRAAGLMAAGNTVALFCHPKFSRPEFRPDYTLSVKPWDDLVSEIHMQQYLETKVVQPGD